MSFDDLLDYWTNMFGKRELVKKSEAIRFLGYSDIRTLNKQIAKGLIKLTRLANGDVRIHKNELLNFIEYVI